MNADGGPGRASASARVTPLVVLLFFAWGFATVLIDSLIPKLKALFTLSYTEVMLTQFAFFLAYFLCSLPAGAILAKVGYVRSIIGGLLVMALGCVLFIPAAIAGLFPGFLCALFVMAAGITMLQVAANPFIAVLGSSETSHSRLNLAQAFNSLGTFVGPFVGAAFIIGSGELSDPRAVEGPFIGIAAGLLLLVAAFWRFRGVHVKTERGNALRLSGSFAVLSERRLAFGALGIFVYVGAEVSIGSIMTNYLMQPTTLALEARQAGALLSLYWGGAMIGRFIGSWVMRRVSAGAVLGVCALGAAVLGCASALSTGVVAGASLIAIGLCNSIMFPTIFTLAIEKLGPRAPQGSAVLCLAIVGGAVVPLLTGTVADRTTLATALFVPVICYCCIALYGLTVRAGLFEARAREIKGR